MFIKQTNSTNTLLKEMSSIQDLQEGFTIYTDFQTSGRGQQGNSWESAPGENLLFSTLFRLHDIPIQRQFLLSELVPLAIVNVLEGYLTDVAIKWPNDIYWRDKKLGGILIEHILQDGLLDRSIVGVGLNVNQLTFQSKAPNPISIKQILRQNVSREILLGKILDEFVKLRPLLAQPNRLKEYYMAKLYRRVGFYPYIAVPCSIEPMNIAEHATANSFLAEIADVTDTGCIVLRDEKGESSSYHFKEVKFVIEQKRPQEGVL